MQHIYRRLIWVVIGKTFTNQSFPKNKAVINGETVQIYRWISAPRFDISKNPFVRRCSNFKDCLTPLRILKCIGVGLKMDSGNAIKNFYML